MSSISLFTFQTIISYFQSKDNLNTSLLNRVPCVPACQLGLPANVLACQRGLLVNVPAYQQVKGVGTSHVYVRTGHKCANVPIAYQCFIRRANVSNGVPTCQNACQLSKHSSYEMLREISPLYYYIKNSTLYLIL